MRVLVTGHLGYIGSVLVPQLLDAGHQVSGLDSGLFECCVFGKRPSEIASTYKDIRDVEREDLAGYEAVIHLAGLCNDPLGDINPDLTDEINCKATLRLAEIARDVGVKRILYASSCSTYGAAGQGILDEDSQFAPVTPYAASKVATEKGLSELVSEEFCVAYLRCATAFGASPRIRFDLVANNLTAWAYTSGVVYLKSDGSAWRPLIHVEDIARTYTLFLTASPAVISGQAFNIGRTDQNFLVAEIAGEVERIVLDSNIKRAPNAMPDSRSYKVSFEKLETCFPKFRPFWDLSSGIHQLLHEYRDHELKRGMFEGPDFQRVGYLLRSIEQGRVDLKLRRVG